MFFHTWEKSLVKLDNFLEFEIIFVLRHKLRNLFCFLIFWKTKEKEKRKKRGRDCHTYTHTHTHTHQSNELWQQASLQELPLRTMPKKLI